MEIADTPPEEPPKRKRGRPAGARNKYSRDARAFLAQRGPAAVGVLLNVAVGRAVWGASERGKKQRLVPDLDQQLSAAKWIGERLLPALRASDVSSVNLNTNLNAEVDEPVDTHKLAKVLASVISRGAIEADAAAETQGSPPARSMPAEPPMPAERAEAAPAPQETAIETAAIARAVLSKVSSLPDYAERERQRAAAREESRAAAVRLAAAKQGA